MNTNNLKRLLQDLKVVISELESEIYSDPSSYNSNLSDSILHLSMDNVLDYSQINDDDEEGL